MNNTGLKCQVSVSVVVCQETLRGTLSQILVSLFCHHLEAVFLANSLDRWQLLECWPERSHCSELCSLLPYGAAEPTSTSDSVTASKECQ